MQNKSVKVPGLKPRNHTIELMKQMKAGSHRKSNKSQRHQEKRATLKEASVKEVFCFCNK